METGLQEINLFDQFVFGIPLITGFVIWIILLSVYALIVTGEIAFSSLNKESVKTIQNQGKRTSSRIQYYYHHPKSFIFTIITLKVIFLLLVVVWSTLLTLHFIYLYQTPLIAFGGEVVVMIFVLLLFGENIPAGMLKNRQIRILSFWVYPVQILETLFRPFYFILPSEITEIKNLNKSNISIEEISDMIDLSSTEQTNEGRILNGAIRFGDTDVKEIMKSRVDVVAVEYNISFKELVQVIIDSGYSRLPVYKGTFDAITGILYIKDLLPYIYKYEMDFQWQKLIRVPYYVPETKKINDLLKGFQQNKTHMAIINDEYGGTYGIATMEDVLEEIVGEIRDEAEEDEIHYSRLDDHNYLFDGKVLLNDFYKVLGIQDDLFDDDKGDADTLAGFILNLKGELPRQHDVITYKNFIFKIESVDKRRIKQIKVTITPNNAMDEDV